MIGFKMDVSQDVHALFAASRAMRNQKGRISIDLRLEKGDVAVVLTIDAPRGSMLAGLASWLPAEQLRRYTLADLSAEVVNNVIYIRRLEMDPVYGAKMHRPIGWIRLGMRTFAGYLTDSMQRAIAAYPDDPRTAIQAGLNDALMQIQTYLADNTPVVSGRAKGGWMVHRKDGSVRLSRGGAGALRVLGRAIAAAAEEAVE